MNDWNWSPDEIGPKQTSDKVDQVRVRARLRTGFF